MNENIVKGGGAVVASVITFLFGGADALLTALIVFVAADYVSGILTAVINGKLSSKAGLLGFLKKLGYFMIVLVGHFIDTIVGAGGGLRALVIGFLIANEGLSILENWAGAGLPVPKKLLSVLAQLKQKDEEESAVEQDEYTSER